MVERNRTSGASELVDESDWSGDDESDKEGIDDTEDDGEAVFTDDDEQNGNDVEVDDDDDLETARRDSNDPGGLEEDSDEFDASDAEFDNLVASYQEPEPENGTETAPSTCQRVEEVVSVQVGLEVCLSFS